MNTVQPNRRPCRSSRRNPPSGHPARPSSRTALAIVISSDDARPSVFAVDVCTSTMFICVEPHADNTSRRPPPCAVRKVTTVHCKTCFMASPSNARRDTITGRRIKTGLDLAADVRGKPARRAPSPRRVDGQRRPRSILRIRRRRAPCAVPVAGHEEDRRVRRARVLPGDRHVAGRVDHQRRVLGAARSRCSVSFCSGPSFRWRPTRSPAAPRRLRPTSRQPRRFR